MSADACAWPTPRQFVDTWATLTDEERLDAAAVVIQAGKDAAYCNAVHKHTGDED